MFLKYKEKKEKKKKGKLRGIGNWALQAAALIAPLSV